MTNSEFWSCSQGDLVVGNLQSIQLGCLQGSTTEWLQLTMIWRHVVTMPLPMKQGCKNLPIDLLDHFAENCIIHSDIASRAWLQPIVHWQPDLVCMSAPCPPWSTAGFHKGLTCHEGLLFPEAIMTCKWIQPKMVLVEQVSGFAHHQHKHWILKTFNVAGYRLLWAKTLDIKGICPTSRSRWIALFVHAACKLNSDIPIQQWQTQVFPNPASFDAVFPDDLAFDPRLTPDTNARRILGDKKFLPPAKRAKFSGDAFADRVFSTNQTAPTFMASYWSQHCIDEDLLRNSGCLTHLIKTPQCDGRYWHPGEVFMLHLGIRQFYIDANWTKAFRYLGNQIAVPHAILALTNALRIMERIPQSVQVDHVLQFAIQNRVTADNMIFFPGHNGVFIAHKDFTPLGSKLETEAAVAQLHSFGPRFLPDDSFWSFDGIQPLSDLLNNDVSIRASTVNCLTWQAIEEITPATPVDPTVDIPPTIPFITNQLAILHLAEHVEHFWVASDVNPVHLCQLWGGWVQVTVDDNLGIFHLHPTSTQCVGEIENCLAVVHAGDRFHICNVNQQEDIHMQIKPLLDHDGPIFDQFGKVGTNVYQCCTPWFAQSTVEYGNCDIEAVFLLAAFSQVSITQNVDMQSNSISYSVDGPSSAVKAVLTLFHDACGQNTLALFRRKALIHGNSVIFSSNQHQESLPIATFRIALVVAIIRVIVKKLQHEPLVNLQVKWLGRPLTDDFCSDKTTIAILESVIILGLCSLSITDRVSLISSGQRYAAHTELVQLVKDKENPKILFHAVRPFSGGGLGSKQAQRVQIKNTLAGSLLEQGIDLQWITNHVDQVVDKVGIQKLAPIAALRSGEQRDRQIIQIFADCNCPVPAKTEKNVGSGAFQHKAKKRAVQSVNTSDLAIDCEFIRNEDGSPTQQIAEFRGQRTGVLLTSAEIALPWIREGQVLSADELGMVVIGDFAQHCNLPNQQVLVPCKDGSNRDILLAATLVQFGTKQLAIKSLDKNAVKTPQCQVTSLTMWKSEWSNEEWSAACNNTMQFIRDAFSFDGMQEAIVTTWGRSLRKGRQTAIPSEATSIQVHASIRADMFHAFLGKSGFNRIWTAPKKEDGRLSDDFRVIWFEGDIQRATSLSATLGGATGLIQGKNSFGLRFTLSSFSAAWKHIHPDLVEPEHIISKFVYKIEPLPFGCSPEQIREWSQHLKWKCRPLKALGARAWIVAADAEPPSTTVAFNGQTILIRLLPQKGSPSVAPIVAGPRAPKAFREPNQQLSPLQFDPWAQYKGLKQPPIAPNPVHRSVAGPSETRLQQQDDKIDAIEKQIQSLTQCQEKHTAQVGELRNEIQKSEHRIADQVRQSIGEVRHELSTSVKDAMKQQSKQFEDNMRDLRLLFQQSNPKRKNENNDMEPWLFGLFSSGFHQGNGILNWLLPISWVFGYPLSKCPDNDDFFHSLPGDDENVCLNGFLVPILPLMMSLVCHLFSVKWSWPTSRPFLPFAFQGSFGKHCSDPHVLDRWCVICDATKALGLATDLITVSFSQCIVFFLWLFDVFVNYNVFQAYRGIRIGEAKNPGPNTRKSSPTLLNIAVVNPTAVLNKVGTFLSLKEQRNIHVFAMSETSATLSAQKTLTYQFARQRLKVNWSPPVLPQRDTIKCDRGKASGTALVSSVPMRPCRFALPDPWRTNTRFNRAIIQVGQSHFQIWTVYGYTSSQPRCKERTNEILTFVNSQLDMIPLPFLICGDFNAEVTQLPIWSSFSQRGAQDLAQIHQMIHGSLMPPTCHHATRPDSAIVSKEIVPLISSIRVLSSTWFSAHAPVVFSIRLKDSALFRQHFTLPRSFMEFAPSQHDLAVAHQAVMANIPCPSSLEEWGDAVEATVDQWLQHKGEVLGIPTHLPKAYRGRCREIHFQKKPVVSHLRSARQGDYEPPDEILSMQTKRKVTQHRRIESLLRRLKAVPPTSKGDQYFQGLCQEWICILKSKCHGPVFAQWLSTIPELGFPPWPLPTVEFLFDLLQHSRFHIETSVARDRKVFQDKALFAAKMDRMHMGSKQAFSRLRGAPKSPTNIVKTAIELNIPAIWNQEQQIVDLSHDDLHKLQASMPIFVDGQQGKLCHFATDRIVLHLDQIPDPLPTSVVITQNCETCDPQEVADKLSQYWKTWWTINEMPISDQDPWDFDDMLRSLPNITPLDIELTVEQLKLAITRLRPNSARGFDGISAFELQTLPDSLLEQLLKILLSYTSGFPAWFMRARTFPLRKCDGIPLAHQTRPITVLSQLYRVWGALVGRQILMQWQHDLPCGITGMLPSRGSHFAAYASQIGLEIDHHLNANTSGVTLDLRKCFNLISHQAGRRLLLAAGVPSSLVEQWISSIRLLSRYWEIESSHFGPIFSNNGFPEGDIWSVVVMIAIGVHWISTIENAVDSHPQCTAYADNWGWKTDEPASNVDIALATCDFLIPYGLQIDWNKTWCWGTSTALAKQVQKLIQQALPDCPIEVLSHSRDLGFELQYSGAHRVGHRISRYEEGFRRLERLANLKVDLTTKEHALLSSIWPATLYGCEIFPPPCDLLTRLASQAADALLGKSKAMSPCIALLLLGSQILDPTFVSIHMALRAARTWLFRSNAQHRHWFFHLVATGTGRSQDIKGPASALRYYLDLVAWQCDKLGYIQVAPFLKIHLLHDSWHRIEFFLTQSWQHDLIVTRTHRTTLFGLRDISRADTAAILAKFDDSSRRKIVREIAGAFQTTSQKHHWVANHTMQCPFCTETDSKFHRLCQCPAFAEIREPYQAVLSSLQDSGHSMLEFPVIHVHQDHLVHQHLQYLEPRAVFTETLLNSIRQAQSRSSAPLYFFTDGSCFHPIHATTRYASFSIVLDLCNNDRERLEQIDKYNATGKMPDTLVLVATARVFGEQTINRAELMAITELIKNVSQARVYSDSSYACKAVAECHNSSVPPDLEHCDHLDLHLELQQHLTAQHEVVKIAAHQDLAGLANVSKYLALGNQMANDTAIATCLSQNKPWQQQLELKQQEVQSDRNFLYDIFSLHILLGDARSAAEKTITPEECNNSGAHTTTESPAQQLAQWHPSVTVKFDNPHLRSELREYFCWGEEWSYSFDAWLQTLEWDANGSTALSEEVGVTWFELALSYMLFSERWIPCLRMDHNGDTMIVFPTDNEHAEAIGYQATDAAVNFAAMWTQYQSLMLDSGPVPIQRGLQRSLAILGAKCRCSGFAPRPMFPLHGQVVRMASEMMLNRTCYKFPLRVAKHLNLGRIDTSLCWELRKSHLKFGQSKARCLKRTLAD